VAGEDAHATGENGLQRAKEWLDMSTRVRQSWTNREHPMAELLSFSWPHSHEDSRPPGTFTFDLGGRFRGGSIDEKAFLAEIKAYKKELDLPTHYRDFLAKCYVAIQAHPRRCDNFLWISWSPFQAQKWDQHATAASVSNAVMHKVNRRRTLGTEEEEKALRLLHPDILTEVAQRIWLITLCDKQEELVLTPNHYGEIAKLMIKERGQGL
jgi:hypothetical protein